MLEKPLAGMLVSIAMVLVLVMLIAWAAAAQSPAADPLPGRDGSKQVTRSASGTITPTVFLPFEQRPGHITITIWHQWRGETEQAYQDLVDDFNATPSYIQVELTRVEDLSYALSVSIPAGVGPDLVAWTNDQIGTQVLAGHIVSLDPWLTYSYFLSTFEPAAIQGIVWHDLVWGVPLTQQGIALVYNRALIDETMLPDPDDFSELRAKAAAFQLVHPDKYYLCNQGLGNSDTYHVSPVYMGHGLNEYGGYVDDSGQVYMTTTAALEAAQWIASFRPYAPESTSHDFCNAHFLEGDFGIWWTGPWALADMESAGIDYGLAPMGSPYVGLEVMLMTRSVANWGFADEAMQVIRYFASADVQKQMALARHTVPANTAALQDPEVQAIYEIAGFGESLHRGTAMANHPYGGCQWGPVGDATTAIWTGALTPEAAMMAAQEAMVQAVDDMQ